MFSQQHEEARVARTENRSSGKQDMRPQTAVEARLWGTSKATLTRLHGGQLKLWSGGTIQSDLSVRKIGLEAV